MRLPKPQQWTRTLHEFMQFNEHGNYFVCGVHKMIESQMLTGEGNYWKVCLWKVSCDGDILAHVL